MIKSILLYLAVVVLFVAGRFLVWRKSRGRLGAAVVLSGKKAKAFRFVQTLLIFLAGVGISIYCIWVNQSKDGFSAWLVVGVFGVLTGSFGSGLMMHFLPIGLYEHGALTLSGQILYSQVEKYEIASTFTEELRVLNLFSKSKMSNPAYTIYLQLNDVRRAKAFLRTFSTPVVKRQT